MNCRKPFKFLDVGLGFGSTMLRTSHALRNIFPSRPLFISGIEMKPLSIARAEQKFQRAREERLVDSEIKLRAYLGNVFPRSYPISDEIKWGVRPQYIPQEVINQDPYATGLRLDKQDLFTVYQYASNTPPILRLLSEKARSGAHILHFIGGYETSMQQIPPGLRILDTTQSIRLYQVSR